MVSVSVGCIRSRYAPAAVKSGTVTLSSKGFLNAPPSPPLVTPSKNQPIPGGSRLAGASCPFFIWTEGRPNMKELISGVLAFVLAVPVQRIETERPNRGSIKRVETAMDHLTV